ncbi:MAG: HAMP domain-containing histidine kinase, partial [Burkholderiales bacterium]|nr:HAMP domain-containing histidine kinase [Burkholderiales bacterium]
MKHVAAALPVDPGHRNLARLFLLRWVALGAMVVVIVLAARVMALTLPLVPLASLITAGVALNLWTGWRLTRHAPVGDRMLFLQLAADVAILTAALYFTGGWSNPFATLYLLPVMIAATVLAPRFAWTMAAATFGCYTLLGFWFVPLPHVHHEEGSDFGLHVLGMWASFGLCAGAIAWVVTLMARSLRDRDRALAEARERGLRDQQVLALGTLAAGAAHELGTPLSTMAVVVRELEREHGTDPELVADLRTLREQVEHCKHIISDMAAAAGEQRAEDAGGLPLDEYLERAIEGWRALRPGIEVRTEWNGPQPAPRIINDRTLGHTIVSLLNNAADASHEGVEMQGRWTRDRLTLEIRDRGTGVEATVA